MSEIVDTEKETITPDNEVVEFVEIDDAFVNRLESRVGAYKKLIQTAYKLTSESDWVNQSGKFYLQASGCEKVKNPFGISWERISRKKEEREDEKGPYYIYFFQGTFYSKLLGSRIEVIGKRSSRSAFFGRKAGDILPLSEVDEEDIAMSAMSNMIVNGVGRLIGMRNPTEDQLKSVGLDLSKIQTVKYEGQVSHEESSKGEEAWKMLVQLNDGDEAKAREQCLEITSFKTKDGKAVTGKKDPRDLSGKWLENTFKKIKEIHEKRFPQQSRPAESATPTKEEQIFADLRTTVMDLKSKIEIDQWWGTIKETLNNLPSNLVNNLIAIKEQRRKEVKL